MAEWFEEWFGEEYLALYPHRDDAEAARLAELIARTIAPLAPAQVLDVACGAGRHARAFCGRGWSTIGLDLSWHLLQRARIATRAPLVRADMRELPIRPRSADLTVNLFTSFGYFEDDLDHLTALRQMLGTLRPGGWFVIDFFNAAVVREALVPEETVAAGPGPVRVNRWIQDDRFVIKTMTVPDGRQFLERVRLFTRSELVAMISAAGGRVRHQFGTYAGDQPSDEAPRVVLFAQTN